jgi:hypothetical protein
MDEEETRVCTQSDILLKRIAPYCPWIDWYRFTKIDTNTFSLVAVLQADAKWRWQRELV